MLHVCTSSVIRVPSPVGNELYNFGRPLLGHHYYTLSLSNICPAVKWLKYFRYGVKHYSINQSTDLCLRV